MRTTLDLPEKLVKEALQISGFKSKTEVVILSLRELVRKKRLMQLKDLAGKVDLDIDLGLSRRRPYAKSSPKRRRG